jgi:hypothetical protein
MVQQRNLCCHGEKNGRKLALGRRDLVTDLERAGPDLDPDLELDLPQHRKPQVVLSYAAQFHYRRGLKPKIAGAAEELEL